MTRSKWNGDSWAKSTWYLSWQKARTLKLSFDNGMVERAQALLMQRIGGPPGQAGFSPDPLHLPLAYRYREGRLGLVRSVITGRRAWQNAIQELCLISRDMQLTRDQRLAESAAADWQRRKAWRNARAWCDLTRQARHEASPVTEGAAAA